MDLARRRQDASTPSCDTVALIRKGESRRVLAFVSAACSCCACCHGRSCRAPPQSARLRAQSWQLRLLQLQRPGGFLLTQDWRIASATMWFMQSDALLSLRRPTPHCNNSCCMASASKPDGFHIPAIRKTPHPDPKLWKEAKVHLVVVRVSAAQPQS